MYVIFGGILIIPRHRVGMGVTHFDGVSGKPPDLTVQYRNIVSALAGDKMAGKTDQTGKPSLDIFQ